MPITLVVNLRHNNVITTKINAIQQRNVQRVAMQRWRGGAIYVFAGRR